MAQIYILHSTDRSKFFFFKSVLCYLYVVIHIQSLAGLMCTCMAVWDLNSCHTGVRCMSLTDVNVNNQHKKTTSYLSIKASTEHSLSKILSPFLSTASTDFKPAITDFFFTTWGQWKQATLTHLHLLRQTSNNI